MAILWGRNNYFIILKRKIKLREIKLLIQVIWNSYQVACNVQVYILKYYVILFLKILIDDFFVISFWNHESSGIWCSLLWYGLYHKLLSSGFIKIYLRYQGHIYTGCQHTGKFSGFCLINVPKYLRNPKTIYLWSRHENLALFH